MQEPVDRLGELCGRWGVAQVSLDVLDGAGEHVQVVLETVQFVSSYDDLVDAEGKVGSSLARNPVPLTAPLATEFLWTTWSLPAGDHPSAPSTPGHRSPVVVVSVQFRHDEIVPIVPTPEMSLTPVGRVE